MTGERDEKVTPKMAAIRDIFGDKIECEPLKLCGRPLVTLGGPPTLKIRITDGDDVQEIITYNPPRFIDIGNFVTFPDNKDREITVTVNADVIATK